MIDFIKESTEAFLQRIRSPIFGSIALSFVLYNWKPIWYLVFAQQPVPIKLAFFDLNTTNASLFWWPVFIGLIFALCSPWIKLVGALLVATPINLLRRLQFDEAHRQKIYRLKKEIEKQEVAAKLDKERDERLIEAQKRISETEKSQGTGAADELRKQRAKDTLKIPINDIVDRLSDKERVGIQILGDQDEPLTVGLLAKDRNTLALFGVLHPDLTNIRAEVELQETFYKLKLADLASSSDGSESYATWNLTQQGFEIFDLIKVS